MNFNQFPLGRPVIFLSYKHDIYFVHIIFLSTVCICITWTNYLMPWMFFPLYKKVLASLTNHSRCVCHSYKTWPDPLGVGRMVYSSGCHSQHSFLQLIEFSSLFLTVVYMCTSGHTRVCMHEHTHTNTIYRHTHPWL